MPFTIDVHHHILPDFFWQETNDGAHPVGGIAPPPWDEASALAFMDDDAIDVAVTSISTPGVHVGDDARARYLARRCNELAATMTQKRPDSLTRWPPRPDPYQMRRKLLAGKPDWLKVLDTAAENGDWGKPLPKGSGRGIAICTFTDSLCAQVAEVTVKPNGQMKVNRVTVA
jgi:hypothetical protein